MHEQEKDTSDDKELSRIRDRLQFRQNRIGRSKIHLAADVDGRRLFQDHASGNSMKMRLLLALVGLAISFAFPTFAQQKDPVDPRTAQEIRALAMKYDEAINKQDPAAVAALYTENAVYVAHHGTFHGRQAIEKTYADYFQHWHSINHVSTVDRLIAVGNEVRVFGT